MFSKLINKIQVYLKDLKDYQEFKAFIKAKKFRFVDINSVVVNKGSTIAADSLFLSFYHPCSLVSEDNSLVFLAKDSSLKDMISSQEQLGFIGALPNTTDLYVDLLNNYPDYKKRKIVKFLKTFSMRVFKKNNNRGNFLIKDKKRTEKPIHHSVTNNFNISDPLYYLNVDHCLKSFALNHENYRYVNIVENPNYKTTYNNLLKRKAILKLK